MQQLSRSQIDQIALWFILQHAETSFYKLYQHFGDATAALKADSLSIWQQLNLHKNHIQRFSTFHTPEGQHAFKAMLEKIAAVTDQIIFWQDDHYPALLSNLNPAPPLLFVKGNPDILQRPQIAMVGSRKLSPHGAQIAYDFAQYFAERHYVVTSGLALGIDTAAHHGALQSGQTIAVIATGLDQCYPSGNRQLWQQILERQGAIITEFFPTTPPRKEYFPRRNRLISGLAQGTLVVEAALESGSLITARRAADQGKQVFVIPGHIYSAYHQGCHQLIREGATLVDHPEQVLQDLNMFNNTNALATDTPAILSSPKTIKSASSKQYSTQSDPSNTISAPPNSDHLSQSRSIQQTHAHDLPEYLQPVYLQLDWTGISIDELTLRLTLPITELTIALMELELLGVCKQHAGRYLRCA